LSNDSSKDQLVCNFDIIDPDIEEEDFDEGDIEVEDTDEENIVLRKLLEN